MDLATILLLFKSSLLVGALCFLYVRGHGDHVQGLGVLATSFLLQAAATTLAGLVEAHDVVGAGWTLASFAFGLLGYALMWIGLKTLTTGAGANPLSLAFVPPVLLSIGIWASGHVQDNAIRASVFNLCATCYLLACAGMVFHDLRRERLSAKIPLSLALGFGALLCLAIVLGINGLVLSPAVLDVVFFLLIVLFFIICLFIIIMVKERTEADLHRLIATDELTGLPNRRHFFNGLPQQPNTGDAFILLDIDHFKRVNDTMGHAAGDEVLRKVAAAISGGLPSHAIYGRLGGEEFGVFLPGSGHDAALALAELIRKRIESHDGVVTTISAGVAIARTANGISDVMSAADAALYKAKQNGRNRVWLHAEA
ncbi:sensor domain-containing diguanylate cyclase [Rhizobium sp. G21]|uniref:GGDEF domain-containing protein n=1 Tax=Rhizobium sp. G21 TaxID=2758439 RepID=UPI0015FF352C|nr:GGDEF domain-containing protein [Rhizobium sp. G21]MBB1250061.1 diguanylate cyclase [Rhizobium sp. G21]